LGLKCCVDTVHAAQQVSLAPAGVRIRQVASATCQAFLALDFQYYGGHPQGCILQTQPAVPAPDRWLPWSAGLDDHPGGHVVLVDGWDGLPHDLDDLRGEQRVQGGLVDPERLVASDPDVGESCPLQFAGEDTLRHRA
jgi:hypothetical protein